MSLRSTPENASLGASESWRVHVPHYKADVVAFRSLCDEASDHTTDGVFALSYVSYTTLAVQPSSLAVRVTRNGPTSLPILGG